MRQARAPPVAAIFGSHHNIHAEDPELGYDALLCTIHRFRPSLAGLVRARQPVHAKLASSPLELHGAVQATSGLKQCKHVLTMQQKLPWYKVRVKAWATKMPYLNGLGPQEGPAASCVASGDRHASECQGATTSTAHEEQRSAASASLQPSTPALLYGTCTQAPAWQQA